MTGEERQSLDVAAMQRELLELAESLRTLQIDSAGLLTAKAETDGKLAVIRAKTGYIKAQMSAIQSALKSSTAL
jgi:hypothetical protein